MANENHSTSDFKNCSVCGAEFFQVVPGETTKEEIQTFLAIVPWGADVEDAWLHPGAYCPNGCEGSGFRAHYSIDDSAFPREIREKHYDLMLHNHGSDGGKVILYVKKTFKLTTAEARDFIKKFSLPRVIMTGNLWEIQRVRDDLVALGASAEIVGEPDQSTFKELINKMINSYYT